VRPKRGDIWIFASFFFVLCGFASSASSQENPTLGQSAPAANLAAAVPNPASAGVDTLPYVDMTTERLDDRLLIRFKGRNVKLPKARITPSRTGVLLVIPGFRFDSRDWQGSSPRVDKVEISNAGRNASVRILQPKGIEGTMRDHVLSDQLNGALTLTILDGPSSAANAIAPAPSASEARKELSAILAPKSNEGAVWTDTSKTEDESGNKATPSAIEPSAGDAKSPAPPSAVAGANDEETQVRPAWLQPKESADEAVAETQGPTPITIWPTLIFTVMIAAGGYGWVAWQRRRLAVKHPEKSMQVIERLNLGAKHALLRVRVDERELLISQGENGLAILLELGDSLNAFPHLAQAKAASATKTFMSNHLEPKESTIDPVAADRLRMFKQRLSAAMRAEAANAPAEHGGETVEPSHRSNRSTRTTGEVA
jgi:hypothetical protein